MFWFSVIPLFRQNRIRCIACFLNTIDFDCEADDKKSKTLFAFL